MGAYFDTVLNAIAAAPIRAVPVPPKRLLSAAKLSGDLKKSPAKRCRNGRDSTLAVTMASRTIDANFNPWRCRQCWKRILSR